MLRFLDSFDHYAIPAGLAYKYNSYSDTTGVNGMGSVTGRRSGSSALAIRASADFIGITLDSQPTWIVGFAIYLLGTETAELLRFNDQDGTTQLSVQITNAGLIQLWRGGTSGTLLATSATAIGITAWIFVEAKCTIADSGGSFEVRVNETVMVTYSGDTKQSSTLASAIRIQLFGRSSDYYVDDLYICDGTGSVNNTYLGDIRVDALRPVGAGTYADFTRSTGANNWDNVDDTTIDAETTYNYSNTVGHKDTFDCANLTALPATIYGMQMNVAARKDEAGGRSIKTVQRIGSTDYDGSSVLGMGTSYTVLRQIYETSPATSAAYTESEINGAEFGYKVNA